MLLPLPFRALSPECRRRTALVHGERAFTGEELESCADSLAARLSGLGLGAQHRVAIAIGNTPEFVVSLLAAMKLRASSVLLSPQLHAAEIADSIRRTSARLLLATDASSQAATAAQTFAAGIAAVHHAPAPIAIWSTAVTPATAAAETTAPGEITIQFTSGVSGRSKLVPRRAVNLQEELTTFDAHLGLDAVDATVCPAPLFHTYGLVNGFLLPFFSGRPTVVVDRFLPNDVIDIVRHHRARLLVGVPVMYKAMAEAYGATRADLDSLRICFSAGAPLSRDVFETFRARYGLAIHQQYGSTETGVIAINLLDREGGDPLAAGRPLRGRSIDILAANGARATKGEAGEIAVRSPAAATRYLDDAQLTAERFRDGCYMTGDEGRIDEYGDLHVVGRRTAFINVAGLKVDPREVEHVLTGLDGVVECAVVPAADAAAGEVVKAFVVVNRRTSEREVRRFCQRQLAPHKVPRHVVFLDALPRTATGKVLTKYLLES